jgi:RNA polymerase sigma-70 factor (ECF subfamily)
VGPEDAADLRQEVLLRVWDRAGQWEGRGSPLAWLLRIATNLALNHLRAQRARASLTPPAREEPESGDEAPAPEASAGLGREEADFREQAARLLDLLAEMPEEKRTVIRLARLEGAKLHEIAGRLGVPLGTVKSRLHAATQWLAARWEEER